MNEDLQLRTLAHVMAVSRHFLMLKTSLSKIVEFTQYNMRDGEVPDADELALFLRRESTQKLLEADYETSLFKGIDGAYRLICLAVPDDVEVCRKRLDEYPISTSMCSFCLGDEKSFAPITLVPELDLMGKPVHRRFLHPNGCRRSWLLMRNIAERVGVTTNE